MNQHPSSRGVRRSQPAAGIFSTAGDTTDAGETLATIDAQIVVLRWAVRGAGPRYPARIADGWAEIDRLLDRRLALQDRSSR